MRRDAIDRPTEIHIEGLWIELRGLEAVERYNVRTLKRTKGTSPSVSFLYLSEECDHKRSSNFIVKLGWTPIEPFSTGMPYN